MPNFRPNLLDRMIYALAPTYGGRRIASRRMFEASMGRIAQLERRLHPNYDPRDEPLSAHYPGSEKTRTSNWISSRLRPDEAAEQEQDGLRLNANELYRSNPMTHGLVESRVAYEVCEGSRFQPLIMEDEVPNAKEINRAIAHEIEMWSAAGCEDTGTEDFGSIQRMIHRSWANSGEVLVVLGATVRRSSSMGTKIPLCLRVYDCAYLETPTDKIHNPRIRLGVQYNDRNQIEGYWVRKTDSRSELYGYDSVEHEFLPRLDRAGNVFTVHLFDRMFPGQSRGLPWLFATLTRFKDIGDYLEAEVIAKQIEACFAVFIKNTGPNGPSPYDVAKGSSTSTDAAGRRIEEITPGMVEYLGEGQDVSFGSPTRPGNNFTGFMEYVNRSIASGANFSYELFAKNWSGTNFSVGRLSTLDSKIGMRTRAATVNSKFMAPLYRRLVFDMVRAELIPASVLDFVKQPAAYLRHRVLPATTLSFIDPEKEINAHVTAVNNDMNTASFVAVDQGLDYDDMMAQRLKEKLERVRQEVEVRKARRDMEVEAGLPPLEVDPMDEESPANGMAKGTAPKPKPQPVGAK